MTQQNRKERLSSFQVYWRLYGGWPAILSSRYLRASFVFALVCLPILSLTPEGDRPWIDFAISIIPSLMAFSLSAMAILLAFSNEKFLTTIQKSGQPDSLFMKASATLFHFILVQTLSLFVAFLLKSYPELGILSNVISFFGFWLLSYGLGVAVATAGLLLKLAEVFNAGSKLNDTKITISILKVTFDDDAMWLTLSDGRVLGVPLVWFPRLLNATPEQREAVEITPVGLHWEELDEDISIPALLNGPRAA